MSCLIFFVWAAQSCEECENRKMKNGSIAAVDIHFHVEFFDFFSFFTDKQSSFK